MLRRIESEGRVGGETIDTSVFNELQSSTGNDFVSELVTTFLEEAPGLLAELRGAAAARDVDCYRRAAHSLKSNAQTFGATRLGVLARELEQAPLGGNEAQNSKALAALEAEYAKAAAALTALKG
jgi:histidine phosphotransfer protein HptB